MKFLVDRCAGYRLAEWLRAQGHDVVEVSGLGPDPGDQVILATATQQGRILVTIDTDFGRLIHGGNQHMGLIRLPDMPAAERIALFADVTSTAPRRHGIGSGGHSKGRAHPHLKVGRTDRDIGGEVARTGANQDGTRNDPRPFLSHYRPQPSRF